MLVERILQTSFDVSHHSPSPPSIDYLQLEFALQSNVYNRNAKDQGSEDENEGSKVASDEVEGLVENIRFSGSESFEKKNELNEADYASIFEDENPNQDDYYQDDSGGAIGFNTTN